MLSVRAWSQCNKMSSGDHAFQAIWGKTEVLPIQIFPFISPIQIFHSAVISVNILKNRKVEAKISCVEFTYSGDSTTLGSRWESWSERLQLFIEANGLDPTTDAIRIKASLLLLMGQETFEVYKKKRKANSSDTLNEVQKFMADRSGIKRHRV